MRSLRSDLIAVGTTPEVEDRRSRFGSALPVRRFCLTSCKLNGLRLPNKSFRSIQRRHSERPLISHDRHSVETGLCPVLLTPRCCTRETRQAASLRGFDPELWNWGENFVMRTFNAKSLISICTLVMTSLLLTSFAAWSQTRPQVPSSAPFSKELSDQLKAVRDALSPAIMRGINSNI